MNRSRELELIDEAIEQTMKKGGSYNSVSYITDKSLSRYLFYNVADGFTRDNSAREHMESLNRDIVNKEMLKNIVKITALKNYQKEKVVSSTKKSFDDALTIGELEYIAYTMIKKMNKDDILQVCLQYPKFYQGLMFSFVYRRHFDKNHTMDMLDDKNIMKGEYKLLQDKIDNEYSSKKTIGY